MSQPRLLSLDDVILRAIHDELIKRHACIAQVDGWSRSRGLCEADRNGEGRVYPLRRGCLLVVNLQEASAPMALERYEDVNVRIPLD